jgi:hypothetical protein
LDDATITAEFFAGLTPLGTITRTVNGDGGARLFAGLASTPIITHVSILANFDSGGFAIGNMRYGVIPEPGTLWLGLAGALLIGIGLRKRGFRGAKKNLTRRLEIE